LNGRSADVPPVARGDKIAVVVPFEIELEIGDVSPVASRSRDAVDVPLEIGSDFEDFSPVASKSKGAVDGFVAVFPAFNVRFVYDMLREDAPPVACESKEAVHDAFENV
jgi:hypothetical protein